MKKILLSVGLFICSAIYIQAQDIADHAIGLRLGDNNGFGSEISYQRKLEDSKRLEVNLGLSNGFSNLKLSGLYEWVWHLEDNFNWYAGAGAGLYDASGVGIFASGVVGIEYGFKNIPLQLTIDYRPEIGIIGDLDGIQSDIALSVRYQF